MTLLVGMLPVRNGAALLPRYLAEAARYMDGLVALDDGSTDETGAILASCPLVRRRLANPRRDSYLGWDDGANRARLLEAAAELRPRWLLSLDADELIDAEDAQALRRFLKRRALPGVAYGLRRHRMIGDLETFDKGDYWAWRVFAAAPGQRFPVRRLHFEPVPDDIPHERRIRTDIRVKHLAGLTEADRRARFEKYRVVDPEHAFQDSYDNLLEPPATLRPWRRRAAGEDILIDRERHDRLAAAHRPMLFWPMLSWPMLSRRRR